MAIWDYQFILFPIGNVPKLTDDGIDFVGTNGFEFAKAVEVLESTDYIKNDSSLESWNSFDDACYFLYEDGKQVVEIELNSGTVAEKAEEISVRTNIYKEEGSITEALHICRMLCDSLNLCCWSMKLSKVVNLNDVKDVENTISHFNKLLN